MTRGAIDLKIVSERIDMVRAALAELRQLPQASLEEFTGDRRNIWSADALLRRAMEALFDTARHLLAKAHGRGGLEYREVARLALEQGLVTPQAGGDQFTRIAGYRNRLMHHYDAVTPDELFAILRQHLGDIERLADGLEAAAAHLAAPGDPPAPVASQPGDRSAPGAPTFRSNVRGRVAGVARQYRRRDRLRFRESSTRGAGPRGG